MNKALLFKWLWRFGTEEQSLWKRVIVAKYGASSNGWWPNNVRRPHGCGLWIEEVVTWNLHLRREPRTWEVQTITQLRTLLQSQCIQEGADTWSWKPSKKLIFSVLSQKN
ncbi:hypothetical protein FRX31_008038 [Thalictrum thalictroides]|uniref:Uncharacterized protein n=1 Tax=Thalictrum thalictroides TaxID=46969 RepID=A0A7J6X0L5_THATH|nr:hypothetical protein FRX31_008038 [Thalictrum thalictroides]